MSYIRDAVFYRKLGKDLGYAGAALDEHDRTSKSWQSISLREGYRIGVALRGINVGYKPDEVPLVGMPKKYPKLCHIEHPNARRDCGCGFGQCAKGLIL